MLCERFPGCTPFSVRKERARDVFDVVVRFKRYAVHEKRTRSKDGKRVIRKPAGDSWF